MLIITLSVVWAESVKAVDEGIQQKEPIYMPYLNSYIHSVCI
mgnify:CR=1 FL=1